MGRDRHGAIAGGFAALGIALFGCVGAQPAHPDDPSCSAGEHLDLDGATCVPEPCGLGPWGDAASAAGDHPALYVAPWGEADGDGAEERPFGSVEHALASEAASDSPTTLLLAGGSYAESVAVGARSLRLVGRCTELTILAADGLDEPAVTAGEGADLQIERLTIRGGAHEGLVAVGSAVEPTRVELTHVHVLRPDGTGIDARGATLTVEGLQVTGGGRHGIRLVGGSLVGGGVEIRESSREGLRASGDVHVDLDGLTIVGPGRRGLLLEGGRSTITNLVVDDVPGTGVAVHGLHTKVTLLGGVISDTAHSLAESRALEILHYGSLDASDLELVDNHGLGIAAGQSRLRLRDVTVRSMHLGPDGLNGHCAEFQRWSKVRAQGTLLLEDCVDAGLFVGDAAMDRDNPDGGFLVADEVVVRRTRSTTGEADALGVSVVHGGGFEALRLVVEDTEGVGVGLEGVAWVEVESLAIHDSANIGLLVHGTVQGEHPTATVHGGRIVGVSDPTDRPGGGIGVVVQTGGTLDAEGLRVADASGPGLYLPEGGVVTCRGCVVDSNGFAGAVVIGGALEMVEGRIQATRPTSRGGGVGVFAWNMEDRYQGDPPFVRLDGVEVSGHPGPGLYFRGTGLYRLRDVAVHTVGSDGAPPPPAVVVIGSKRVPTGGYDSNALGLLVEGSSITDVPTHAILLDGTTGRFDDLSFAGVGGFEVYRQHCDGLKGPDYSGQPIDDNGCAPPSHNLQPLLQWLPTLSLSEEQ
jgi:hypothetical protein